MNPFDKQNLKHFNNNKNEKVNDDPFSSNIGGVIAHHIYDVIGPTVTCGNFVNTVNSRLNYGDMNSSLSGYKKNLRGVQAGFLGRQV